MGKAWIRQEIKRNEVAVFTEKCIHWVRAHRQTTMGLGITILAAILLAVYFIVQYVSVRTKAWEQLAIANSYAYTGDPKAALEQLRNLRQKFSRADAVAFAGKYEGDLLYRAGKYKEAIEAYEKTLQRGKPASILPFVMSDIVLAHEASGSCQKAIAAAGRYLEKFSDHFLTPQVQISLARCQQSLNKTDEARSTYENLALIYPGTFWARKAQETIKALASSNSPAKPK